MMYMAKIPAKSPLLIICIYSNKIVTQHNNSNKIAMYVNASFHNVFMYVVMSIYNYNVTSTQANVPAPSKCKVRIPPVIIKNVETKLEVTLRDKNDNPLSKGELIVIISSSNADTATLKEIKELNNYSGIYEVSFIPKRYGDHMISILINGEHFLDSPYK